MTIEHCEECHSQLRDDGSHYHMTGCVLKQLEIMENALKSIAANTCCDSCQEAARVAKKALGA